MASIEKAINWFKAREGKVTYSMLYRNGPTSYDCSSSVYYALIEAGYFLSSQWIGNTDSLYGNLESRGWVQLQPNAQGNFDTKRGDIFLWGVRGASGGAFGHTGMFVDADNIIHCSSGYNGIHTDNYDWLRAINGYPVQTFYRFTGNITPAPVSNDPHDQELEVGSYIKFNDTFTADDVQIIGGIWQVRTNVLCRKGFTWEDNGIPAEPLIEVDVAGYKTADQSLDIASLYKLPGKYRVLDLGQHDGMWLAQIEASGVKFWVDVATAIEVPATDNGTPVPSEVPAPTIPDQPQPVPENPVEPELPPVPINDPTTPSPVEPEPENPVVVPPVEEPKDTPVTNKNILTILIEAIIKAIKDWLASRKK